MTAPSAAILNAIAILRAERDKIDAVIVQVSSLFGLTAETAAAAEDSKPRRRAIAAAATPRTNGAALETQSTKILEALRKAGGSLTQGGLVAATNLSAYLLNNRLTELSAKRLVVITGASSGKRIALPGASAKEAP